jgi:hypothetical protein
MKKIIYTIAILVIALTACTTNSTDPIAPVQQKSSSVILPLSVGNIWKYQVLSYDCSGKVINRDTLIYDVENETVFYSESVKIINVTDHQKTWNNHLYYITRNDGTHIIPDVNRDYYSNIYLKFPAKKGESFIGRDDNPVIVLDDDAVCNVTAGAFSCYKYEESIQSSGNTCVIYASPGIGVISEEIYFGPITDKKLIMKKDLLSYSIK